MLDSKQVREFTPEKAVFGGYDVKSVDTILDEAADDMEALEKENEELRAKLKVLVDKLEEYRRIESGIRQALMTAQNMAEQTTQKANEEAAETRKQAKLYAEQLKADTASECETMIRQYQIQASQEQARMQLAQRECASFIEKMARAFREQSEAIAAIAKQEGLEITTNVESSHTVVHSETLESRVEGPAELEIPIKKETPGTGIPDDILKIFADAKHASHKNGMEETAFTVEVSGSQE
ncbi:MAG: DivIVA domain-containing protein [Eubacteriales bacterium]|nr:DivIVA domain-containing protein [Eubacteriales bacterium]